MKPGHDIADGRCTWLIVVALQRASPAQKLALIVCNFSIDFYHILTMRTKIYIFNVHKYIILFLMGWFSLKFCCINCWALMKKHHVL